MYRLMYKCRFASPFSSMLMTLWRCICSSFSPRSIAHIKSICKHVFHSFIQFSFIHLTFQLTGECCMCMRNSPGLKRERNRRTYYTYEQQSAMKIAFCQCCTQFAYLSLGYYSITNTTLIKRANVKYFIWWANCFAQFAICFSISFVSLHRSHGCRRRVDVRCSKIVILLVCPLLFHFIALLIFHVYVYGENLVQSNELLLLMWFPVTNPLSFFSVIMYFVCAGFISRFFSFFLKIIKTVSLFFNWITRLLKRIWNYILKFSLA